MNSDSRTRWWTMWLLLLAVTAHVVKGNADWSATCTSGCTCKWADGKKVAECPNAGLTTIPDNLSPEIQVLDLRGNQLGALVSRAFSSVGLVNLQRIFLRNCSIQSVDKNAFDELTIMIEVDLSHNKLSRIHPDTFANNGKLRTLSLSHNPLEKLEAHQFPPLPLLRQLELVNCNLEVIDRKAFMHLGLLQTLRLSENRFTSLKSDIFQPLNKLKSLDLQDNPWVCDCRLVALRDFLTEANLNSMLTLCVEPEHLKGRPWSRLPAEDFACKPLIDVTEQHIEGRLGFDVTFSCRVSGNPLPTIWWVLQNRQIVNTTTPSQGEQFVIKQASHPLVHHNPSSSQPIFSPGQPGVVTAGEPELEYWSNLTLRRISEHDAGQYKCVARNKGGQVDASVNLQTPPAPVTILIEEETGITYNTIIIIAVVVTVVLLAALSLLTVCLYRRSRKKNQQRERNNGGIKLNGSLASKSINGNGSLPIGNGTGNGSGVGVERGNISEQEKSLLEIEMMDHSSAVIPMQDGYQAVAQTDVDMQQLQQQYQQQQLIQQQHLRALHGSNTYIPADRFDTSSSRLLPETLTRHLMMPDGTVAQVQQLPDGSFYPDLLDIPHRGSRGGGSPSTHSGASASESSHMTAMPLSVAHLTGQHPGFIQPPMPFSDTSSTTSSSALLIPMSRPGYVTLPRRPRPRVPSWASSPQPMSSTSTDPLADEHQPLYDTIGPRVTADGSSSSALSLNKIAGLTPGGSGALHSPRSSTLARGHKISLPAYYVPIAEVDVPPASPLVQRQHQSSTPNMLYEDRGNRAHHHHHQPTGFYPNQTPPRPDMDMSQDASEILSPIPDFRTLPAGSRSSVSSLSSNATATAARRKTPPAVAPKPSQGVVKARPASVVPFEEEAAVSSPVKVAPKPPPKPKKRQNGVQNGSQGGGDNFEDEGEDGTEV